jgi:hypothetical protein
MSLAAWKSAIVGFLLSSTLAIAACAAFYFLADNASMLSDDLEFRAEFADELRFHARTIGEILIVASASYWCVAALYGKGNVLTIKWANYPLIAAFAIAILLLSNRFYWNINTYCDVIIPGQNSFSISKLTQCPSSGMVFSWLQTFMFLLAFHSLLYRIIASKKIETSIS